MNAKIRIMAAAARIRMKKGMALEDILCSWKNLKDQEREQIRRAVL